MKKTCLGGILAIFVLAFPIASFAKTGSQTFIGRGTVFGHGEGNVVFAGQNGTNCIMGTGTLTVSKRAWVNIEEGNFERTESRGNVTYVGTGEIAFGGSNVQGSFVGTLEEYNFSGRGKLTLSGTGTFTAFGKSYTGPVNLPPRRK